ncbi:MAG: flagellar biosynthesis protein FlhB [Vampirovibrionia bacterium]
MSGSTSEKTEKATPRRRKQAREEGQVLKSTDLNSGIMLSVSFAVLFFLGQMMLDEIRSILETNLTTLDTTEIQMDTIIPLFNHYVFTVAKLLAPLLGILVVIGFSSNLAQVGPLFSTKAIKPKITKINPLNGFKKMFSLKSIVELIKGTTKMAIIGFVGYYTIYPRRDELMVLQSVDLMGSLSIIFDIIFQISWKVCIILIVLGIADYAYQKYEFEKSIKMTKQEIKDEHKNIEGNPEIKRKVKSIQFQMATNRMMSEVPKADVVVTNPTHFAVALKYDVKVAPAPMVVAKGVDLVAKRIKDRAKEHKVPIVENKPLARSLYKLVEINRMVPEELFVAVAEILAYIYKKNKKRKNKRR